MATELEILLKIREQGQDAFNRTNAQVSKLEKEMARTTASGLVGFRRMSSGVEDFANGLASGNIVTSIRAFASIMATALRSVSTELAVATAGLSIIAAAIAIHVLNAKKAKKELDDIDREYTERAKKWNDLRIDLIVDEAEAEEERVNKKHSDLIDSIKKDTDADLKALDRRLELKLIKESAYWKEADKITKRFREMEAANRVKWDADLKKIDDALEAKKLAEQKKKKPETDTDTPGEKSKLQAFRDMVKWGDTILKKRNEQRDAEERETVKHNAYLNEQAEKSIQDAHLQDMEKQRILESMLYAQAQFAIDIGAAMTAGLGKGAEGLKGSAKAILTTILSFIEKQLLAQQVAAMIEAAILWSPAGLIKLAATTAAFEAAKIGINSFESGTRFAPGGRSIVGERGIEMMEMPSGARVYNNTQTRNMTTNNNPTVIVVNSSGGNLAQQLMKATRNKDINWQRTLGMAGIRI